MKINKKYFNYFFSAVVALFIPFFVLHIFANSNNYVNINLCKSISQKYKFTKLIFIKRYTLTANHVYTEYLNSKWLPGGNICILDLQTGKVKEIIPRMSNGVFNRFDIAYDAKKIVFDWKKGPDDGYRIYEVNIDGTGLKQLTFPEKDEPELKKKYSLKGYHHGTDDIHPCYLPDGGIVFVSTRCQYSILCSGVDIFTTKVLYRMNHDGKNIQRLSSSPVSEASPVIMHDGRILYHRWEYVDKPSGAVKALWAMKPDGSGSVEIYGNTITDPETMIYARPIPGINHKFVMLGTTHCCPNNAMGAVILLDINKDIRSRDAMTFITKDIEALGHNGFYFKENDKWKLDKTGINGRLFKDPYPLSGKQFLVSQKLKGIKWNDPKAYHLYVLNENGETELLYKDSNISSWHPYPLLTRNKPLASPTAYNEQLAKKNLAACIITDIYHGMKDVKKDSIKYLRILEQVPRPWTARNFWPGDKWGMAHTAVGIGTLGLKVQYGVVPVEKDGSAYFLVPTRRNIFFQALDENYMAVQTERTYVNYMPGETRSCIGCHETANNTPATRNKGLNLALQRSPSFPGPQPGDKNGLKLFDYERQIQPIWDKNCIQCHNSDKLSNNLDLSATRTALFNTSYENLIPNVKNKKQKKKKDALIGRYVNENDVRSDAEYFHPYTLGSHTSILAALLSKGKIKLKNPQLQKRVEQLIIKHKKINISQPEFIKVVNWIDTSSQYYGSYWGRKNLKYKEHPNFRPQISFSEATNTAFPHSLEEEHVDLFFRQSGSN